MSESGLWVPRARGAEQDGLHRVQRVVNRAGHLCRPGVMSCDERGVDHRDCVLTGFACVPIARLYATPCPQSRYRSRSWYCMSSGSESATPSDTSARCTTKRTTLSMSKGFR